MCVGLQSQVLVPEIGSFLLNSKSPGIIFKGNPVEGSFFLVAFCAVRMAYSINWCTPEWHPDKRIAMKRALRGALFSGLASIRKREGQDVK